MIISHKFKFIFIKTQKTAGSSIEKFLLNYLGPDDIFAGMPIENISSLNCKDIYEHCSWQTIQSLDSYAWNNYYKFTIERNSWDKVVSLYWFFKKHYPKKTRKGFDTFILNDKNKFFKDDWSLYTDNNNLLVDDVIQYNNLDYDFEKVCNKLNIPYNQELRTIKMKSGLRGVQNYQEMYNEKTKLKVFEFYRKPIEFYNYSF
jgi:hypothetical protein